MKLGYNVSSQAGDTTPDRNVRKIVEQARAAESAGFDLLWAGHHYLVPERHLFQAMALMPHLAAETDRIHLGMNVLLPLVHPVGVAEHFATMDAVSGGRTIFGPVAGYRDAEFDAFGVPKSERAGRLEEGIEVVRRLWTEDGVSFDGRHFTLSEATISPKPVQRPRPPIWVGANRDRAIERAGRIADAWLINPHEGDETIARQLDRIDPPSGDGFRGVQPAMKGGFVAETDERALEIYEPYLRQFYEWYADVGQDEAMETPAAIDLDSAGLDRFVIGSPETVADRLVRLHDDLGIDCVVLFMNRPGIPQADVLRAIELVGSEVLPRVEERTA